VWFVWSLSDSALDWTTFGPRQRELFPEQRPKAIAGVGPERGVVQRCCPPASADLRDDDPPPREVIPHKLVDEEYLAKDFVQEHFDRRVAWLKLLCNWLHNVGFWEIFFSHAAIVSEFMSVYEDYEAHLGGMVVDVWQ